jgi:DNA-binding NarL/FixJ family response regulator
MKSVFIVEDHAMMRRGIVSCLESSGCYSVLGEAGSLDSAKAFLEKMHERSAQPDAIILDIDLNEDYGLNLLSWYKFRFKDAPRTAPPTLIYSIYEDYAHIQAARRIGAQGYVSKGEINNCLLDALAAILSGKEYIEGRLTFRILDAANALSILTRREQEVFLLVQEGRDNKQIAKHLSIDERTVQNHLSIIYDKLNVKSRNDLAKL